MNYLITGHPRTRSAWFCALLNAHGSTCYHDAITNGIPMEIAAGISDPGIACLAPRSMNYSKGAVVCIERPDWRPAFEAWSGVEVSDLQAAQFDQNVRLVAEHATLRIQYADLEKTETVAEVIEACIQRVPQLHLLKIFDQLQIEQHIPKAQFISSLGASALI